MSYFCPTCQRILYNRRLAKCGFCGAPIPEAMRFTPAEAAALEKRAAEIEQGARDRAKAREEEDARRRKAQEEAMNAVIPFFFT